MIYLSRQIGKLIGSIFDRDRSISPSLAPAYASDISSPGWDANAKKYKYLIGNPSKPRKRNVSLSLSMLFRRKKSSSKRKRKMSSKTPYQKKEYPV